MDTIRRRHRTLQAAALVGLAMLSVSLLAGGTLRASDNRVITDVTLDGVDAVVKGMPQSVTVELEPGASITAELGVLSREVGDTADRR